MLRGVPCCSDVELWKVSKIKAKGVPLKGCNGNDVFEVIS